MADLINLEPDEADLLLAATTALSPCPFCGDGSPVAHGKQNTRTGNVVYHVMCTDYRCNASVFNTAKDRETARTRAIENWQRRKAN